MTLRIVAAVCLLTFMGIGLHQLRAVMLSAPEYSDRRAEVRLTEVSGQLPAHIAAAVRSDIQAAVAAKSLYDDDLTRVVHDAAKGQAWVARVHRVSRAPDGAVEVVVDSRQPFALVRPDAARPGELVVVDVEGVVLPVRAAGSLRKKLLTITGVAAKPPGYGERWNAPDLLEGIESVKLLKSRPYAGEISLIDVRNHRGRIDPTGSHVHWWAQVGQGRATDIRFGRFPTIRDDYCEDPEVRMKWLDGIVARNGGRLAGVCRAIELRYEKPYVREY